MSSRGTVILVALCFVAVMAIVLGSYLAVCTRAMQLSNRSFQTELSKQLAEAGIDEALRAFNKNDWSNWNGSGMVVDWDTTTYAADKRAVATISFPSTKFGQGVTAEVKVRVDNNDAHVLDADWSDSASYQIGDVVGYGGNWFTCVQNHSDQTPTATGNLAYWVPAPIPWKWSEHITYTMYDVVNYQGIWYRYVGSALASPTNPSLSSNWVFIPSISLSWSPNGTAYTEGAIIFNDGFWYYCTTTHSSGATFAGDSANWSSAPTWTSGASYKAGELAYRTSSNLWYTCKTANNDTSFNSSNWVSSAWAASRAYTIDNIVNANGNWWRCTSPHTSSSLFTTDELTRWTSAIWASGATYTQDQVVLYQGEWWTCTAAFSTSATFPPSDFTRKSYALNGLQYLPKSCQFNDVAYYSTSGSGTWYRRDVNSTTQAPPTNTSYWENALSDSWDWDSADSYNIGDVVYLSSTASFYRCIRAHSNQTPPNTAYWSTEPLFSTAWDSGKSYGQYDTVRYRGSWYLSLPASDHAGNRPGTDDDNWAIAPNSITPWSSAKTYHVDEIVSASGNWYRCKKDHTNQAVGADNTYWVQVAGPSRVWSSSTAYAANSYVSYAGAWYKCLTATTANAGHSPNNPTYWTATWSQSAGVTTGAPVVYAEATVTLGDRTTSRTQLRALIDQASLFPNAAAASTTLTISGGTGRVDSYDSELADYNSTDAGYAAVLAAGTGSASGTSTLLSVGASTSTRGYFSAPASSSTPFAPRASFDTSSDLKNPDGSVTSPDDTAANVDLSRLSRSPYIPEFDIQTPIQQTSIPTSLPSTTYSLNLGTPGAPTPSVYYYPSSLSIATNETVNINGPVILRINGYLLSNRGKLNVTSTGSVVVYLPYVLRSYASAGGFQNLTKDPKKMLFINTSTTSPSIATYLIAPSSSPEFYGAIYMPNTTAALGLDIRTGVEIFGALSAREITFSSEANLHYDTSLRYATFTGVDQPYTVTTWRELPATEQATLP